MKAFQHKPNLKRTAVLLFGIMMSCATVKAQDTPCLPSHGETNNQPAWCGIEQVIALAEGVNWVSFYVETNLDDLKAALVAALPSNSQIKISSQTQSIKYNRGRWVGQLSALDLSSMYKIEIPNDCEISLEGMVIDPTDHPVTIDGAASWIAYPLTEEMTVANCFAGFAVNNDQVKSQTQLVKYNRGRWAGQLTTLVPGQGYIYTSGSDQPRTFVFPTSAKTAPKSVNPAITPTVLRKRTK